MFFWHVQKRGSCGGDQPPAGAMRGIEPPPGRLCGPVPGRLQHGQGNPCPGSWNEIVAAPGGSWGPWRQLCPEIRAAAAAEISRQHGQGGIEPPPGRLCGPEIRRQQKRQGNPCPLFSMMLLAAPMARPAPEIRAAASYSPYRSGCRSLSISSSRLAILSTDPSDITNFIPVTFRPFLISM